VILVRALVVVVGLRLRLKLPALVTDPRRLAMRLPGLLSEATSLVRLETFWVRLLIWASLSWS